MTPFIPLHVLGHMGWETKTQLFNGQLGGSRNVRLPAYRIPDPCFITSFRGLLQRPVFPLNTDAVLVVSVDPGMRYALATGYPGPQLATGAIDELGHNPTANEELISLWGNALGGNQFKRIKRWKHSPAVRYSRKEGDVLQFDFPSIGTAGTAEPEIWFCWNIHFLAPSCYGASPPPLKAWTIGSWSHVPLGIGGRRISPNNSGLNQSRLVWRFLAPDAPAAFELSSVKFRVVGDSTTTFQKANVSWQLWNDAGTMPIGDSSVPWLVNYRGDHEVMFHKGCGAVGVAGTPYRLVMTSDSDALVADIDTTAQQIGPQSGRGYSSSVTPLPNLPNNEEWRLLVSAIVPGVQ